MPSVRNEPLAMLAEMFMTLWTTSASASTSFTRQSVSTEIFSLAASVKTRCTSRVPRLRKTSRSRIPYGNPLDPERPTTRPGFWLALIRAIFSGEFLPPLGRGIKAGQDADKSSHPITDGDSISGRTARQSRNLVDGRGFEPPTLALQTRCSPIELPARSRLLFNFRGFSLPRHAQVSPDHTPWCCVDSGALRVGPPSGRFAALPQLHWI